MKISYNWLKHYLPADVTPEAIAEALPLLGFDIESMTRMGPPPLENVVVGRIESFEQHPNADRLSVCTVVTEEGGEPHGIVCGAKNFKAGDHVMVALPGAVLPGDFKIKRSKLRGVDSAGMLCSARELGVGDNHEGILILDAAEPLGKSVNAVFAEADTLLEVEVTPNRPDCLNHIGIARELAARFSVNVAYPEVVGTLDRSNEKGEQAQAILQKVEIDERAECPYYTAIRIDKVKVGPSPKWLKDALEIIGLRPINNVVDVTNYVLHELGQPLHAFDAAKIQGDTLHVRCARKDERITTLDGKDRILQEGMTVIADATRSLAVAGVMGGVDAEVDETTRSIVLESAYFNSSAVRATARALGLSSDSSYRFERGVDPQGVGYAALRALDLILATAGGEQVGAMLTAGAVPEIVAEIEIKPDFIRERIGFAVDDSVIQDVFAGLELEISEHERDTDDEVWCVRIPSFRGDLERPIDLVEEFIRVYGTDKIPQTRVQVPAVGGDDASVYRFLEDAARLLTGAGFDEALLYSLRSREEVELWFGRGNGEALALANPLASDQSHLRPSLIPGLLDVLRFNNARQTGARRFFERGRVFREQDGVVTEYVSVGFVVLLQSDAVRWKQREQADFFTARGLAEELLALADIRVQAASFSPVDEGRASWQSGHAASFIDSKRGFGVTVGLLDASVLTRWDIDQPVLAGSLFIRPEHFDRLKSKRRRYQPLSEFPATVRDIALLVDASESAGKVTAQLEKIVRSEIKDYELEGIDLFDSYSGKGIAESKRSLAFSLRFRAADRTLREDEVNPAFERMQVRIASDTAYTVRSE